MDKIFEVSMLAFVLGSMLTLGLSLTIRQAIAPFKNVRLVLLALFANFLAVPLFAYIIVWLFPVSEGVRTGIILLSFTGGAPFIPKIVEIAKGHVAGAVALMLLLLIVTIFFMPVAVPLMFPGTEVSSWELARSLIGLMLLPLISALVFKEYYPDFALRILPFAARITNISILMLVITMLFLYTEIIISNVSVLPIILLFFTGSMLIGYLTGGKNSSARIILSVGTALRNPPIAILVASYNFPDQPMAATVALLVMIMGSAILLPLALVFGRRTS